MFSFYPQKRMKIKKIAGENIFIDNAVELLYTYGTRFVIISILSVLRKQWLSSTNKQTTGRVDKNQYIVKVCRVSAR